MKIGIYQSYWGRVGGGQRYIGVVAEVLARTHDVEIVHHCQGFDRKAIGEALEIDFSRVAFRFVPRRDRPTWTSRNPIQRLRLERQWCAEISSPYDLFIDSSDIPPWFCHARQGALLIHFPCVTFEQFHGHEAPGWMTQSTWKRLLLQWYHRLEWRKRFATYDLVLANSIFTRDWIKRRWGLDAEVVNPPLRSGISAGVKDKLVLSIGAFHHFQHKKQDVLIQCFKELCQEGLQGWTYVLVGASGAGDEDQSYLARLRQLAAGYPIEIRPDVSGLELRGLLSRCAVLWHSMGYGVDQEKYPEKLEHFGMVATEALSAGCVPVLFDGGGLREIVSDDSNGFLWSTTGELKEATRRLTESELRRHEMSLAAVRRAEDFQQTRFESRLLQAFTPVLTPFH